MNQQALEPGSDFGTYQIEGLIAGGGMGQVYAARHGVYGSTVALKVLKGDLDADESWRKRFSEEGLVGTTLKHPHVLAARELVEHGGRVALVLDLVPGGQTLERVMSREFPQGLPMADACKVFLGILQGMDYAHEKGVIHGDIKPENILIEGEFKRPETWQPKVTDFGTVGLIAHPVKIDGRTAVVATPRYASPEHLLGVDQIGEEADIYCLGLLLHYLLTGAHASTARNVVEAAERVRLPLPLVNLVDFSDSLITVVQHATMYDPRERYATCRAFALAVREVLDAAGAGLELEDLQGDLATEVMEERQKMKDDHLAQSGISEANPFLETEVTRMDTAEDVTEVHTGEHHVQFLEDLPTESTLDRKETEVVEQPEPAGPAAEDEDDLGEPPPTEEADFDDEDEDDVDEAPEAVQETVVKPPSPASQQDTVPLAAQNVAFGTSEEELPVPLYVWAAAAFTAGIILIVLMMNV